MQIHTDHLAPGMVLEKDIELKAGSYLITRRDLGDGRLTEKVIESVRKFSNQIVPENHKVFIKDDEFALGYIKKVVDEDLYRIAKEVASGHDIPNFLADVDLHEKVMRVMEMLFSNPNIIHTMYDARFNSGEQSKPLELILDHSLRTTLLSVALGLRLRWTIIALVSIGTAALLHDMGILCTSAYPRMSSLDDLTARGLENFIEEHQVHSTRLVQERQLSLSPYQRDEISHIIANHHHPDKEDRRHKNTLLFHFADLADEMISRLPHNVRYNFAPAQLARLGTRYKRRTGLVNLLLGLTRLYKRQGGLAWEIVSNLAGLFNMEEVLAGDFEEKLQDILNCCPSDSARANPPMGGNHLPSTIYCFKSTDDKFSCEHLLYSKLNVPGEDGGMTEYLKCDTLGKSLQDLTRKKSG